ncbi:excalibur calcium-binding domain-containing protein [Nocardioides sp. L-11A]|uniref:excalibur calcium-binding domain-containing protein n=1 Tax=Nocardioides sp. L-11A TaxID=3043848 RepID=UPI00249B85F1|nr:excalibur calcium-binding domain-containing protein [Nocardioides sp. L-11A]
MYRSITALFATFALSIAGTALTLATAQASTAAAAAKDMNCDDFPNQAAAQNYFVNHGGPNSDPDGLDRDGDGIACDSNPCPCSSSTGGASGGSGHSTGSGGSGGAGKTVRQAVRVVKVIDGDTVRVRLPSGRRPLVEVMGFAAPFKAGHCGVAESKATLSSLLPKGAKIVLTSDPSQPDKIIDGRLFRYIDKGGKDIGKLMLKKGWVSLYFHKGKKFKRVKAYRKAQQQAQAHARGAWGPC